MKPYIFTERNSIHIIDLQKTVKALDEAYELIRDTVAEGGTVLFVGTKRQAQETIQLEATRCEMPYVTARWLGGMLTNWRTIRERINELERLERMRDSGEFDVLPKKEVLLLTRKIDRLEMLLGGIRSMVGLPDILFAVDVRREETAIHEANLLDIPVVALVDTNCNPKNIDYIIPSNDDAIRAIKLLVGKIADAVIEGKAMRKEEEVELAPEAAQVVVLDEPELSDEELLGEATLAKLASSAAAVEEAEGETEQDEEEITEGEEGEEEVVGEEEQEVEAAAKGEVEAEEETATDEEAVAEAEVEVEEEVEETVEPEEPISKEGSETEIEEDEVAEDQPESVDEGETEEVGEDEGEEEE
jgi:small subunit ribosomal protein S2